MEAALPTPTEAMRKLVGVQLRRGWARGKDEQNCSIITEVPRSVRPALSLGDLPPLPVLKIADKLGQLSAQVEGSGQPRGTLRTPGPASDGGQAVLYGQQVLTGELVE